MDSSSETTLKENAIINNIQFLKKKREQGDLEIKVSAFSDISHQLNYKVLAHLSERINRRVI